MVFPALDRQETGVLRIADQPHRFPWGPKPGLDLRTDGDPFHIPTEHVGQEIVPLMSAVEPDFISEETTADP